MRVWQAQIGLGKRVEKEYYGYVEVRDYNPNEFELPNPLLMLYLTQKDNSKALDFLQRMFDDRDGTISAVKARFDKANISAEVRNLASRSFAATFNQHGQNELQKHMSDLTEAFALGVALGRHDPNRRGETPVMALGLHKEAAKELQKGFPEDSVGGASALMITRGFFLSRSSKF